MSLVRTALSVAVLAAGSAALAQTASPPASLPLALKGNDPVSYFTDRRPVKGASTISHDFQQQRYYFSSAKNRELFVAEPARYAPQFGGFSAAEVSAGSRVAADPAVFVVKNGKLYVFSTTDVRDAVLKNPVLLQQAHDAWKPM
jgi:YHS domain-containing protein